MPADPTVQRVLKRLAVIQSLLTLHETEDLPKHLDRLKAEPLAVHTFALNDAGRATLKKLYREAAQLCHPDRVADAHQAAATAAFQQVLGAYQRQDVAALQAQLLYLRRGIFTVPTPADTSVETLSARRNALAAKHAALLHELAALRASEAFALAQADEVGQHAYLSTNRAALLAERDRLRTQWESLASVVAL